MAICSPSREVSAFHGQRNINRKFIRKWLIASRLVALPHLVLGYVFRYIDLEVTCALRVQNERLFRANTCLCLVTRCQPRLTTRRLLWCRI